MAICNTHFDVPITDRWTYCHGDDVRAIDFICIDKKYLKSVLCANATCVFGVGNEHRSVRLELCTDTSTCHPASKKVRRKGVGWEPSDGIAYTNALNTSLCNLKGGSSWCIQNVPERCTALEECLVDTANAFQKKHTKTLPEYTSDTLTELITLRMIARRNRVAADVRDLSKLIQKQARRLSRWKHA